MGVSYPQDAPILSLPETLLEEVLYFLSLVERRRLLGLSKDLWNLRRSLESSMKALHIGHQDGLALLSSMYGNSPALLESRSLYFHGLQSLQILNLGVYGTDEFLVLMAEHDLFENLQCISMIRSHQVTDQGLLYLSMGEHRSQTLREIDITFCRNTTYSGTFPLRDRLTNLKLIRRQPKWLDGRFHTPFGDAPTGSSDDVEVHTYWPDGTFEFNRDTQSSGFVCDLQEWERSEHHLGDKLQYNNFVPPLGWPDWTRFCYRPGVSLFRMEDAMSPDNSEVIRSVLVSQRLVGLRPPKDISLMEQAKVMVPMGKSRYFDRRGEILPEDASQEEKLTMISRMRLYPLLESQGMMPPRELVQRNKEICEGMDSMFISKEEMDRNENWLHTVLSDSD